MAVTVNLVKLVQFDTCKTPRSLNAITSPADQMDGHNADFNIVQI